MAFDCELVYGPAQQAERKVILHEDPHLQADILPGVRPIPARSQELGEQENSLFFLHQWALDLDQRRRERVKVA